MKNMNKENEKIKIVGGLAFIVLIMVLSYIIYPGFQKNRANFNKINEKIFETNEKITEQNLEPETEVINEEGENLNYIIGALYPKIVLKNKIAYDEKKIEKANFIIKDHIGEIVDEFKKNIKGKRIDGQIKHVLYGDYSFNYLDSNFFSLKFNISEYISGAVHPINYVSVLNYNLQEEKKINFNDIFKKDTDYFAIVSTISAKKLLQIFKDDSSLLDWIKKGTAPKEENYSNFGINEKGIIIYFNPYQVGSYSSGIQEIEIAYSELVSYLDSNSVIGFFLDKL